ncbi:MAG: metallophosphoesterase [Polaromonas sp.]|nr:metallophosphoesterase [Polaromonas sp.]
MKILQLSDPHFGTAQPAVMQALRSLVQAQRPDMLVLSGDITQRASEQQFAEAKAYCDSLRIGLLLALPGNHDIPLFNVYKRLFSPYGDYLQAFGPVIEATLNTAEALVIGVNTTRRWRHKNGEVSNRQISRVVKQLEASAPGQLRVVVVHQPVHVLRAEDEHDRLRNWQPAVRAWSAAGADIIMGGHIHLPYVCDLSSQLSSLARRTWCVQAGTALSSRVRQGVPNSVNLLKYDFAAQSLSPLLCDVERWNYQASDKPDHQAAGGQFARVKTFRLVLDRSALAVCR